LLLKENRVHELPVAVVSHRTGSRLRIKIPSKRRDEVFFTTLAERMSALEGVRSVESNPLTGSILLTHASDPDRIIEACRNGGLLKIGGPRSAPTHLHRRLTETFESMDGALRHASGNEIDIGGVAFLTLAGVSIYQISIGNAAAIPWYGAAWYALNIFLKSNSAKQPTG
jgi:hypothetical protein